jgi:uridine kinase
MIAKLNFKSEEEKKSYVLECENDFEERLDTVIKSLCETDGLQFVTLSGPTCSGKTTASKKMVSEFSERGRNVKIISIDDFFRDRTVLEREAIASGGKLDFDSEKALDLPFLSDFMHRLQNGMSARLPHFDFVEARRVRYDDFSVRKNDIVIFEGIQAIYPAFTSLIEEKDRIRSFYISPLQSLDVGSVTLDPREVRLWRRLVRDYKYRAAAPEFSFHLWESVTENEDKNILPFALDTDFRIDSLLGYEPCMLKDSLCDILSEVRAESKYYGKAQDIINILKDVQSVSDRYLPKNSLYHEFM